MSVFDKCQGKNITSARNTKEFLAWFISLGLVNADTTISELFEQIARYEKYYDVFYMKNIMQKNIEE